MAKSWQEMFNEAARRETRRASDIYNASRTSGVPDKSAATRIVSDIYRQEKKEAREAARDQARIDKEVFRNKVSNIKLERAEKLKAQKDLAREEARVDTTKRRAVQGLVTATRQMMVGAIATSAASVSLLTRTAQHFSPASAIRYERAMGSLAATVGMVLAPSFQKLTEFIEGAAKWVANLSPNTKKWLNLVVMIATPLSVAFTLIGGMAMGVFTIVRGFSSATKAVLAYAGALRVAASVKLGSAAVSGVAAAATGAGAASAVGAGAAATGVGAAGAAKGLGLAGAGVIGAGALGLAGAGLAGYSLFGGEKRRDNLEASTRNMLGVNKGPLSYLFGWKQSERDKRLENMYKQPGAEALQSANYPVQTQSSVLDAGRSFRQQSAQQSSLKSFNDYWNEDAAKAQEEAGRDNSKSAVALAIDGLAATQNNIFTTLTRFAGQWGTSG